MSNLSRTYLDFYNLVCSLAGVSDYTIDEQTKLLSLANRRFREAYDQTQLWSRYLVVGEARTVDATKTIPFAQTGKTTIGEFIRVHKDVPFASLSSQEYEFYVDSVGAHILNVFSTGDTTAYVTYKKDWDGPYTASTTNLPNEFFYYAAHATYADALRLDGQVEKAVAEENTAKLYLQAELAKAEMARNLIVVGRKIKTHLSSQKSV